MFTAALAALTLQIAEMPDASWLEGCWEGEGLGARVSECWMRAPDGRMTGMFQLIDETGAQQFSEIILIDAFEDGVEMRLKHFNPDLTGWEAQDAYIDWTLVEAGERRLSFHGIEYQIDDQERLIIDLDMRRRGEIVRERFTLERVD
ncbi:MAG: DUF6265 family protein [Oceanicaulis sp.]